MQTEIQDTDQLTLDDVEALILMNDEISAEVKRQYVRLIEKLRAQLITRKDLNEEI